MREWANIEIPGNDAEIAKIDAYKKRLGPLSSNIIQVRELITRFEVCHFKAKNHLIKIKQSISDLTPAVAPHTIGQYHIQHSERSWRQDSTGRSLKGQKYIWAINNWFSINQDKDQPADYDPHLGECVKQYLGTINIDKVRLLRLLLSRLNWDWKALEKLQIGGIYNSLENQIIRIDICHYAFEKNMKILLQGIGKLQSPEHFEGCGSCNKRIKHEMKLEVTRLNKNLRLLENNTDRNNRICIWLLASLIKTLKAQTGLLQPELELKS